MRLMRLRYTAEARAHIEAIRDYIHERNALGAKRVAMRIRAAADRLAEFPYIGHVGLCQEVGSGSYEDFRMSSFTRYDHKTTRSW